MCGIIACIAENCNQLLYDGIIQLKNRGYDSVGICTIQPENQFSINKFASTKEIDAYSKLEGILDHHKESQIGIAHTRWATHGAKTDINSHPHQSSCGKFVLVHNGIIENYKELKKDLLEKGYIFKSQTDTEVIVQFLSYLYSNNKNINECIQELILKLDGTWGLAIICIDTPDKIYCTRHGSPLLIGYDDETVIITSEKSGFTNKVSNYFVLKNFDICVAERNEKRIDIHTQNNYDLNKISHSNEALTPAPYPHWTLKEIYEQIDSSQRAISMGGRILYNDQVKLGGLEEHIEELMAVDHLILLGCGTSYFAGQHGAHFLKELCNFNTVQLFDGAEFDETDIPKKGTSALLLISQSGETKDLHRCIELGKKNNLFLIGLVNVVDSLIAREVDCGCYLNAGREVGVASTKAYTSQVILLSMIAIWFAQHKNINNMKRKQFITDLRQLSNDIQQTIYYSVENIDKIVDTIFKDKSHCFLLGKGRSESVAKEGALKIKEISYIHSEGYSTSALKHGPFALLDENFPVIIMAPKNEYYSKSENAYEEIKARYAPILFITTERNDKMMDKENVLFIKENKTFGDLLGIIPLQILAYHLSISRGINPDIPKNLAKVVTVE
jgi:glucosamine--fructose-6-phosphate aminotransferase (isomerizing)